MKLLVTGGCGFIGSNFIRYMLNKYDDLEIVNLDAMTYAGQGDNLRDIQYDGRYEFLHEDITNSPKLLSQFMLSYKIDSIIHFAAESHVDRSIYGADVFVNTNVLGTQNLLDSARMVGVNKFVHVSTDEVYGSLGAEGKFTETTYLKPNSPYAASKTGSDLMVLAAYKTHNLPVVITRCSNNYGPYQYPEKLIPLMITNAMEGKKLPVYGNGKNVRDWIHVIDHCRAIDDVLHKGRIGEVYNIGGNCERANINIVQQIEAQVGGEVEYVTDRKGHDFRYAMDFSKIRDELGWVPEYSFEEGLTETINWYKENKWWWKPLKHKGNLI